MDHWMNWVNFLSHLQDRESDLAGYVASVLVLATFSMKSMRSLRMIAVLSNIAFIVYAVSADIRPVLVLHTILLPVNIFRLVQLTNGRTRQVNFDRVPLPPTDFGTGARSSVTKVEAYEICPLYSDRGASPRDIWVIPSSLHATPHK